MRYIFIATIFFALGWTSGLTDSDILKRFDEINYLFSSEQFDNRVERCDMHYEICTLKSGKDCRAKQEKCTIEEYRRWNEIKKQRGW